MGYTRTSAYICAHSAHARVREEPSYVQVHRYSHAFMCALHILRCIALCICKGQVCNPSLVQDCMDAQEKKQGNLRTGVREKT